MQNTADWLSALTLKASYGAQGNDNLGTYYASSGLYSIVSQAGENALVSDRLATPDLKWETNLNLNVGIDFSLFDNRFLRFVRFLPAPFQRPAVFPSVGNFPGLYFYGREYRCFKEYGLWK